jgi:tripartite-type tricarboxylate transporter receptor subunit TctC
MTLDRAMIRRRGLLRVSAALAALAEPTRIAHAQAASAKPIRLVVPFTPGGSTDILARAIAPRLGPAVVVDNRPGAGGSIGADVVAKAEPDGSTLLMGHIGTLAVNPSLYPRLPYDPLKDLTPVAGVARVPNVLVVSAASGMRSLSDLFARAKAKPGQLTYSSGGNGSAAHIAFEALKLRTRIFASHIPYRGTAPSLNDVLAGQVDATFTGSPTVLPHIKSGRLRALAVSSATRLPGLPDVPTVAESGYKDFEADQWYGVVAPARTPADVIARLNASINAALASPDVAQQLATEGATPMAGTPQAFGTLIAREIPRWREVVRAGNVRPD